MKRIALEETDLTVPDLARLAKNGLVILTRKGKPLAAVRDVSGTDWESVSLANNPKFISLIEASRRSYRDKGGISLEEVRKQFGLKQRRRTSKRKRTR